MQKPCIDDGNVPFLKIPSAFSVSSVNPSFRQVTISWNIAEYADDYSVLYGTSSGSYTSSIPNCVNIKTTSCNVTNLTNGTKYYFKVLARNQFGLRNADEVTSTPPITSYIYFTIRSNSTASMCIIGSTPGTLLNCSTVASGLNNPVGSYSNNGYYYISSFSFGSILQYTIDPSSGLLGNNVTNNGFLGPHAVAVNGNYSYVLNYTSSKVSLCTVNSDGTFSGCVQTPAGVTFSNPTGIFVSNNYAYITNGSIVTKCTVNSDGTLSLCAQTPTGVSFTTPIGIYVYNNFAYIKDSGIITFCKVNLDGTLSICASTALNVIAARFIYRAFA